MSTAAPLDELKARYDRDVGRIYITGTQALVRLPLMQRQRDIAAGIRSGGFISGYRGSPLGGYDKALWSAGDSLRAAGIHFQPGINEDLAATAVWGTQQLMLHQGATVDGVFAIWYGKGPGVDRSLDALRHGNAAGTSKHGGVLLICGDDHGCQSSTLPHQSEHTLIAASIPVLNPSTVSEYLDYGLLGIALSRYSGCWVAFIAVSEAVERSESIELTADLGRVQLPEDFSPPPGGLNIRWPDPPLDQETRLIGPKMQAVAAFARANAIDRVIWRAARPRLGIVTTGKAYLDVLQAFEELQLSREAAAELGISLYKVGMSWPLESTGALAFAEGLEEVLVIEEKRSIVEDQLARLLCNVGSGARPRLTGKQDDRGRPLIPAAGEIDPLGVARVIVDRLAAACGENASLAARAKELTARHRAGSLPRIGLARAPYFCSGCPHNTSTVVPEGSRAAAGIGCHSMALSIPERRTSTYTHMGAEGTNWIGQAPFTAEKHVFQNLGDGTYFHSGLLAIRAAAAAGVNITYKILFNDAVAMTGGQPVEGKLTVPKIARQVLAEGAKKVVVLTDDTAKYDGIDAFGADILHRDELDRVQRELRDIPGLTVLIYDQTCAAENRRRRKRGLAAEPERRVFINESVCEGCGDCSVKSNCISVLPLETQWGRKRQIDQSNCNKDYSCLNGFCPSFVTVRGAVRRGAPRVESAPTAALPVPRTVELGASYNILVTGIGGTGVITIGALLGMAAHLEGKGSSVLDFTGMAQKNGAVTSHVRIARDMQASGTARIPLARADLVLACDMVVAVGSDVIGRAKPGVTRAIVNASVAPTAAFVRDGQVDLQVESMREAIRRRVGAEAADFVDATGRVVEALGDSINTNLFMIGYAYQKGLLPVSGESIERAIELNGVGVATSKRAFELGRRTALNQDASVNSAASANCTDAMQARMKFLTEYQNAKYAVEYSSFIEQVARAEKQKSPGSAGLAEAVAQSLFTLMSYKDEYEVARLYTNGDFLHRLRSQFADGFSLQFHLAPPFLPSGGRDGTPRKRVFGPWMFQVFKVLARLKGLRGTPFDPFGYTADRRLERQLIAGYRKLMLAVCAGLTESNHAAALQLARLPQSVRGFGHIKERNLRAARERESKLLATFHATAQPAHPAKRA